MRRLTRVIAENEDALRLLRDYDATGDLFPLLSYRPEPVPLLPRRFGHGLKPFEPYRALEVHQALFGSWEDRIRSIVSLEAACNRVQTMVFYAADISDVANQTEALIGGLAETQPFLDGNKRTALICGMLFLDRNSFESTASPQERACWLLDAAEKRPFAGQIRATLRQKEHPLAKLTRLSQEYGLDAYDD